MASLGPNDNLPYGITSVLPIVLKIDVLVCCAACLLNEAQVGPPEVHTEAGQQAAAEHRFGARHIPCSDLRLCIPLPIEGLRPAEHTQLASQNFLPLLERT